ncbi:MAG: hypothetical protein RR348_00555 [Clostridia bacterium]
MLNQCVAIYLQVKKQRSGENKNPTLLVSVRLCSNSDPRPLAIVLLPPVKIPFGKQPNTKNQLSFL